MLIAASYLFYAADSIAYLALLVGITLVSYQGGLALSRRPRASVLTGYVGMTLAPLVLFKLGEFSLVQIPGLALSSGAAPSTVVPIGIAFYTLQAVSYLVDVHRGVDQPTPGLETHALYLAFFPQLLAGPIERTSNLVPQLRRLPTPSAEDLYVGGKTLIWGYFLKLVVADNVGGIVDRVLGDADRVPPAALPVALSLYSFQLYFDFLGYTMIALGLGRTFGIRLRRNFDRPYLAVSLRDFWRRWHITLSSWLRDYLYRPLRRQHRGYPAFAFAIVVTFLVSGLWHGAAPNFLLWGAVHACLYLVADALGRVPRPSLGRLGSHARWIQLTTGVQVCTTFAAVTFAWLFFRVEDLDQIGTILTRTATWMGVGAPLVLPPLLFQVDTIVFLFLLAASFVLDSTRYIDHVLDSVPATNRQIGRELAVLNAVAVSLVLFGDLGSREFIYFRF